MSFCPVCGKQNIQGAIFCESCGNLLTGAPAAQSAPPEPPVITRLRKLGGSGLFLTLAILDTAAAALALFLNGSLNLFGILTVISLWLLYSTAKKPSGSLVSVTGLSILRVLAIITMVLTIIGLVFLVLFDAIFVVIRGNHYLMSELAGEIPFLPSVLTVLLWIMSALIPVTVLTMLQAIFGARFYKSVKETLSSGFPTLRSAKPFAVVTILIGIVDLAVSVGSLLFRSVFQDILQNLLYLAEEYGAEYLQVDVTGSFSGLTGQLAETSVTISILISLLVTVVGVVVSFLSAAVVLKVGKTIREPAAQTAPVSAVPPVPPVIPAQPTMPTQPEAPAQPEAPTEREAPAEPEASTQPEAPAEPEAPTQPEAPTEPEA